jgi:YD repeat-containing protein
MSYDINTKLLLHCNGDNGSSSFVDSSLYNHIVTPHGHVNQSTAQYKFSPTSAYFDNDYDDYLEIESSNDDFNFLDNDFTIEFWYKPSRIIYGELLIDRFSNYGGIRIYRIGRELKIQLSSNGTNWNILDGITEAQWVYGIWMDTSWIHIAIIRRGTTVKIFFNGTCVFVDNEVVGIIKSEQNSFLIGYPVNFTGMYGSYIDEVRVINGEAAYFDNFTPPTEEFSVNTNVVESDILINITPFVGYESDCDITIDVGFHAGIESDCYIEINIGYDQNDYNFCNNCDILLDIIPVGLFDSQSVTTEYTYDDSGNLIETVIIDPTTNEPLIIPPTEDEYMSCFGVRAYFQLPDSGYAYEIDAGDIMNVNVKTGINQPIYWSFDLINADRKYSDPDGDYADLLTENLYVPDRSSRRFIAIVLMCVCGSKYKTLVFPRLVIKEVIGTEIISLSGIDEISEYLSRNVTLESYCCQEALSKVIPSGQEALDPELVMSSQYVAVSLTNAFITNGLNNETQLLLNYNYDLPFIFDSIYNIFTVFKPQPQPIIFGEEPGDVPVYQLEDETIGSSLVAIGATNIYSNSYLPPIDPIPDPTTNPISNYNPPPNNPQYTEMIVSIPAKDSNGNLILDSYGNQINNRYIIDPRLPVIAISPLWMKWAINDMCEKIIDNQEGYIYKEYFKVNQYYQDFKFYSDINIQNTSIGSILDNCLGAIPAEYTIDSSVDYISTYTRTVYDESELPSDLWSNASYNGQTFYIYATYEGYMDFYPLGTTIKNVIIKTNWTYKWYSYTFTRILVQTWINTALADNWIPSTSDINSWKLNLNIHDIILDDEKPSAPDWYIPEILTRTSEHQISRTGVDKFNTINVISPLDLGTAQVYPTAIQQPPTANQYARPIFNKNNGDFLGLSAIFPATTKASSYYYTASNLGIAYVPYELSGQVMINFGDNNIFTISSSSSTPATCNIYDSSAVNYYVLTILWSNPLNQ